MLMARTTSSVTPTIPARCLGLVGLQPRQPGSKSVEATLSRAQIVLLCVWTSTGTSNPAKRDAAEGWVDASRIGMNECATPATAVLRLGAPHCTVRFFITYQILEDLRLFSRNK